MLRSQCISNHPKIDFFEDWDIPLTVFDVVNENLFHLQNESNVSIRILSTVSKYSQVSVWQQRRDTREEKMKEELKFLGSHSFVKMKCSERKYEENALLSPPTPTTNNNNNNNNNTKQ
jgi:hypothetical protein